MPNRSTIEWTDYTSNPIVPVEGGWGCTMVSPGCAHCYAQAMNKRFGNKRDFTGSWKFRLKEKEINSLLHSRAIRGKRIFVCDMCDLFHPDVPDEMIDQLFAVFALRQDVTWQVLTKRPERMAAYLHSHPKYLDNFCIGLGEYRSDDEMPSRADAVMEAVFDLDNDLYPDCTWWIRKLRGGLAGYLIDWPLANVWLGVSVENQELADDRIPNLLQCPAVVRFLSCEPLLGDVKLNGFMNRKTRFHLSMSVASAIRNRAFAGIMDDDGREMTPSEAERELRELHSKGIRLISCDTCDQFDPGKGCLGHPLPKELHWVIVGGESGPKARPCDVEWIRSIVSQCDQAGVPCFVKQFGGKRDKRSDPSQWPEDLRVRQFPGPNG